MVFIALFLSAMLFLPLSNAQDAGEYTVTESGDMDADAFADVIVANPDGSITGPITPGEVSVYSGANGSLTITFKGKKPGDSFGYSVAHTGDYNGDGFFDLLIGSPLEEAGRAYTFFGPFINSGPPLTITADAADLMFISPDADAYDFGDLVAPLTDIDGDGLTDARIRSWFLDAAGLETMRTYIVSGETGMPLFTITGNSPFDPWAFVEGDTDDDGDVDQADLDIIIFNLGLTGLPGSLTVTDGDVDGDGTVTAADLALAMANLGTNPFLPLILLTPESGGGMPGQWVEDWDGTMIWLPDNVQRETRIFLAGGPCNIDIGVYAGNTQITTTNALGYLQVDGSYSLLRLESPLRAMFNWWIGSSINPVVVQRSSDLSNPFLIQPIGYGHVSIVVDNNPDPNILGPCFEIIEIDLIWVDSDNDGMPDGWETENNLDPNVPDDFLDFDGDGLNNLSEYNYGTNPSNPDSDMDGASDGAEVSWGGNPMDASDMGIPPAPADLLFVNFCVGDQGHSDFIPTYFSEHWELNFNGAMFRASLDSPTNPNDDYEFSTCGFAGDLNHANAYRGVWAFENPIPVIREGSYTISLNWLSTIYNSPDHDWTLTVSITDANGSTVTPATGGYILSDPDSLLGTHYDQDTTPNQTPIGKTVTLEFRPLKLKLKSVEFGGAGGGPQVDGWLPVHHDLPPQGPYESPQWLDSNLDGDTDDPGERSYPIAYVGGFNPLVKEVRFSVDFGNNPPNSIQITGTASNGMVFSGAGNVVGNEIVASDLTANQPFPTVIRNIDPFTITWSVALDGGQPISTSVPIESRNFAYVLARQPADLSASPPYQIISGGGAITTPLLHTLFDIGCRNADGVTANPPPDQSIIDKIWLEFTDVEITNVVRAEDGLFMSYYQSWSCTNIFTDDLIANLDGQCGSWAKMFLEILKLQGVSSGMNYVLIEPINANGFIVYNWLLSLPNPTVSPNPSYPYVNISPTVQIINGISSYSFLYSDANDLTGIPGQGTTNPASRFNNHQFAIVNGTFYDPSYGITYTSNQGIDNTAIQGYTLEGLNTFTENVLNVDLNGDGVIDGSTSPINSWLIQTNPNNPPNPSDLSVQLIPY